MTTNIKVKIQRVNSSGNREFQKGGGGEFVRIQMKEENEGRDPSMKGRRHQLSRGGGW